MNVSSLESRHEHDHHDHSHEHAEGCESCGHDHSHTPFSLTRTVIGLILITAFKDLRRGILSTNELVALAVTASFASGHYQEAGVVAFFMLIGEIIETRTAEGARASIESLIKLTPTKARRLRQGV